MANSKALTIVVERLVERSLFKKDSGEEKVRQREVALPMQVFEIGGGDTLYDRKIVAIARDRCIECALRGKYATNARKRLYDYT